MTIDLWVDFATQDDTGLPWTLLSEAVDPARIVTGAYVIGGDTHAQAVVEIVDVDRDGVVYVRPVPGPVARRQPPARRTGLLSRPGAEVAVIEESGVRITLPADVAQVDQTGYVWTFLDRAAEPERRQIVHIDVVGVPEQAIEELRHRLLAS